MALTNELLNEIVKWFKEDDKLTGTDEVRKHFSDVSREDIDNALEFLCSRGLLYCSDTFCGQLYGLMEM